jgi:hypothetical protein
MMKLLTSSFIFILLLASISVYGQSDIMNKVKEAIKAGSAKEVSQHFYQTVDVTLEGNIESYSKTQAEYQLKEFFQKYPPASFMIVHQGASKAGMPYAIGQYICGEDSFRVWLRIKKSNEKYMIHEISFIKE